MLRDARHALRQLLRSPGFTAVVVLTLALGIGGTTALFTLINAVLLRPLDYPDPDRIVTLWSYDRAHDHRYQVSGPDFQDWRAQSRSLSAVARFQVSELGVVSTRAVETAVLADVSNVFFSALGVAPRAGRAFTDEEERSGGVVLVSDAFVGRHFAGDAGAALGAAIKIGGRPARIIGVMPTGFAFPEHSDVWRPVDTAVPAAAARTAHNYRVIGRLRAGVTLAQAQGELDGIAAGLAQAYPDADRNKEIRLVPLLALTVGDYQATLWIILGAVGLVLLIACANIANLLLARGAGRAQELAVRAALGAGRGRIARQLFTETLVLAALGGGAGLLAARWGLDALRALAPPGIPRLEQVAIDRASLCFTALVSLGVCLVIGLFPVIQAGRANLIGALHAGGRAIAGTRGRMRAGLVMAQLALSLVLLVGAGLLLESLHRLAAVDPGYPPEELLVMEADAGTGGGSARAVAFFAELRRQAAALPGVRAVSYTGSLPIDSIGSNGSYDVEGRAVLPFSGSAHRNAIFRVVGPGYFSTLGVPVRAGRELDDRDRAGAPRTVVINEQMARAAWPGESPLGHRIRFGWYQGTQDWMTIVGVVADTRQRALDRPIGQELYVPALQHPKLASDMKVVARTAVAPLALADTFARLARSLDGEVPIKLTTAQRMVDQTLATTRFRTLLIGLFAAVALLLAVLGVAGVMAYLVAERRTEIGIRMAVGASPAAILRQFLGRALRLGLGGLALGLGGALAGGRVLRGLLFEISASDPPTIALVSATLLVATLLAAAWPALRAARQSPMTALRAE